MNEIQSFIFDQAFGDSSTSCSEEYSSSDDSDSEYDLSDPEVGMHQYSSDSEDGCSEMDDEGTLSFATSKPSVAHSRSTTVQDMKVQKPGVIQVQGQGRGRERGRWPGRGRGQGERFGQVWEQVGSTSSRGQEKGRKHAVRAAIEDSDLLDVFDLSYEDTFLLF